MTNELMMLYQQLIVDHGKNPRNFGCMPDCSHHQEGHNPVCGDELTLYLSIKSNLIEDAMFSGKGCAISMASASLMTSAIKGHTVEYANELFQSFHQLMLEEEAPELDLGKIAVLSGVKKFPTRIKCATLGWHALKNILENKNEVAKTE
ncbi:MAG: SUF system NifU family Fe-S cluster assembly protein [Legionellales bacterium]|nr:SUF system NifU family Fe-S cluster assembly protein [Legionellales bacterium]OUX68292.1 MAG: SUF system NifU family Fe-S cluster assembly protein [bacterium TMED178]|tara:strand:+ start:4370 stop:4816 length:447 start_codon:yes stop_codon:yes gene_type:complete